MTYKTKLHIHSDNQTWAGCENMPGVFLRSEMLRKHFNISFSYRETKAYNKGLYKWVLRHAVFSIQSNVKTLNFWSTYLYKIRSYFKPIMALKYFFMIQEVWKLTKLFKRIKPDILHINNGGYFGATSCNSAVIAGKIAGIKAITYMINSTATNKWWEKPITFFIKRWVTKFIVASNVLKDNSKFLHKNNIIFEDVEIYETEVMETKEEITFNSFGSYNDIKQELDNFEIIPNTIEDLSTIERDRNKTRRAFGCTDKEILFLCCGVLERRKGFDIAIDALSKVKLSGIPRSLLIAGSGLLRDELERYANKMRSLIQFYDKTDDRHIKERGLIDDYSLIHACDVLVVPSVSDEDFPNVILIAMMFGKPVIASDIGGISEMIEDKEGGNGYVVRPGNPVILADRMYKLLKSPLLRESMSKRSFQLFSEKYLTKNVVSKYIDLWNSLLS